MQEIISAEDRERARVLIACHSGVINGIRAQLARLQERPSCAERVKQLEFRLACYLSDREDCRRVLQAHRDATAEARREARRQALRARRELARARGQGHRTAAKKAWRHRRKAELEAAIAA